MVFKEYDVPLDADAGLPANFVQNDGSDWSLGTPSVMIPGWGVHDAWLDLQGDLWFTCNIPNKQVTDRPDRRPRPARSSCSRCRARRASRRRPTA